MRLFRNTHVINVFSCSSLVSVDWSVHSSPTSSTVWDWSKTKKKKSIALTFVCFMTVDTFTVFPTHCLSWTPQRMIQCYLLNHQKPKAGNRQQYAKITWFFVRCVWTPNIQNTTNLHSEYRQQLSQPMRGWGLISSCDHTHTAVTL